MKKYIKYIHLFAISLIISCNKHETTDLQEPGPPQMLHYIDSMLAEVGVQSYTEVLTGKLEGNFEIFAYTAPYESNCTPFTLQTELNGSVRFDSINTANFNAGDLYINNLVVHTNDIVRYEIHYGAQGYNSQLTELNNLYGKTNRFRLVKGDSEIFDKSLYIPEYIYMKGYNCSRLKMQGDPIIAGTSTVTWNADYNNKNGVLIQILGKDADNVERYTDRLVSDIGKYTITADDISIYPKDKNRLGLKITITRGNFFLTKGADGRKYNFTLATNCDYYYELP